jgi:hypothetical protein
MATESTTKHGTDTFGNPTVEYWDQDEDFVWMGVPDPVRPLAVACLQTSPDGVYLTRSQALDLAARLIERCTDPECQDGPGYYED